MKTNYPLSTYTFGQTKLNGAQLCTNSVLIHLGGRHTIQIFLETYNEASEAVNSWIESRSANDYSHISGSSGGNLN